MTRRDGGWSDGGRKGGWSDGDRIRFLRRLIERGWTETRRPGDPAGPWSCWSVHIDEPGGARHTVEIDRNEYRHVTVTSSLTQDGRIRSIAKMVEPIIGIDWPERMAETANLMLDDTKRQLSLKLHTTIDPAEHDSREEAP